jgi:hypothetical protein
VEVTHLKAHGVIPEPGSVVLARVSGLLYISSSVCVCVFFFCFCFILILVILGSERH